MMLSLDTAYRSFGGEVEASSTPTICRLPDSRRHQLSAIALRKQRALTAVIPNDKARHRILPTNHRRIISFEGVFTQAGPISDVGRDRYLRSLRCKFSLAAPSQNARL